MGVSILENGRVLGTGYEAFFKTLKETKDRKWVFFFF